MLATVIRQALSTMLSHRRWAALTMFGIVWGTASVVLLVGWGIGVHGMVDEGMQKVGKNLVYVLPGRVGEDLSPADERKMLEFDLDDVAALRAGARHAELVGAEVLQWSHVRSLYDGRVCDVRGLDPDVQEIRAARAAEGRLLSRDDVRFRRRVAVIGQTARRRLLGGRPALGARLNVRGTTVEVVGVLERVGTQLSRNRTETDEQVWLPISTAMAISGAETVHVILVRPPDRRVNAELKREIRQVLGARLHVAPHDEEAVFIISLMDILSGFDAVFAALNTFYVILAVGTLLIGGIGVMNMMLVAVNERRREIGLRLAVGARRRDVVAQFLAETLVITGVGGGIGLGAGLLGCLLLGRLRSELVPVPVVVPEIAVLALVVTAVVGVLSGTGPAWRAAAIDPAESLRAE